MILLRKWLQAETLLLLSTKAPFGTRECQSSARLKKSRGKKSFQTHTSQLSLFSPLPVSFFSSIKFQSYSSYEVPRRHYLSLVPLISPVFQCVLLFPPVLRSSCLCLTKTQRGVWSSCPICHSDTVATIQGQENKKKTSPIHPDFISSVPTCIHAHTHTFQKKREEMWQVFGNV